MGCWVTSRTSEMSDITGNSPTWEAREGNNPHIRSLQGNFSVITSQSLWYPKTTICTGYLRLHQNVCFSEQTQRFSGEGAKLKETVYYRDKSEDRSS